MLKCAVFIVLYAISVVVSSSPGYEITRDKGYLPNWLLSLHKNSRTLKRQQRQTWGPVPFNNWHGAQTKLAFGSTDFYKTSEEQNRKATSSFNEGPREHKFNSDQIQPIYESYGMTDKWTTNKRPNYDFQSEYERRPPPPPPPYDFDQPGDERRPPSFDRRPPQHYDYRESQQYYDDRPPPTSQKYEGKPLFGRAPPNDRGYPPPQHRGPPPPHHNEPPNYERGPRNNEPPPHDRSSPPPHYHREPPPPLHGGPPPYEGDSRHEGPPYERKPPPPPHGGIPPYGRPPSSLYGGPQPYDRKPPPPPHDESSRYDRKHSPPYHGETPPYDRRPPPPDHHHPPPLDHHHPPPPRPPPDHHHPFRPPPHHGGPPPYDRGFRQHEGPPHYDRGHTPTQYGVSPSSYYKESYDRRPPPPSRDRDTSSYYDRNALPPIVQSQAPFKKGKLTNENSETHKPSSEQLSIASHIAPFGERQTSLPRDNLGNESRSVIERQATSESSNAFQVPEFDIDPRFGSPDKFKTGINSANIKNSMKLLFSPLFQVIPVTPES